MRVLLKKSDSEPCSKRPSVDERRLHRRNSETKSNINRNADKISKVNISDDMEVSLRGKEKGEHFPENISSSNSECSSDVSVDSKKRPVQVDVDNVEFTISPARKLKMVDALIKRFSDGDSGESESASNSHLIPRNLQKAKRSLVSATEQNSVSSSFANDVEDKTEIAADGADQMSKSLNSPAGDLTDDVTKRAGNNSVSKKRWGSLTRTHKSQLLPKGSNSEENNENHPDELVQHAGKILYVDGPKLSIVFHENCKTFYQKWLLPRSFCFLSHFNFDF